jgi:probable F420-dependent oxidoreductase
MKLWLSLPFFPPTEIVELAEHVERLGITGIAISDHIFVPEHQASTYPYSREPAKLPFGTELPDPIVTIAAAGARTTALRFMTYVLLVPLRHPVLLARELATACRLLDGRVDLGVGTGWMREEFEALDVPFDRRADRLEESLEVMTGLWTGELVDHAGEHFRFRALSMQPTPPAPPPLFVGGHSAVALRRAARLASGWVGVTPRLTELSPLLTALGSALRAAGLAERPFEVRTGVKAHLEPDVLSALGRIAVDGLRIDALVVAPWQLAPRGTAPAKIGPETILDALPRLIEQVGAATSPE